MYRLVHTLRETGLKKSSVCTFTDSFKEIQRNELFLNDIIALLTFGTLLILNMLLLQQGTRCNPSSRKPYSTFVG